VVVWPKANAPPEVLLAVGADDTAPNIAGGACDVCGAPNVDDEPNMDVPGGEATVAAREFGSCEAPRADAGDAAAGAPNPPKPG